MRIHNTFLILLAIYFSLSVVGCSDDESKTSATKSNNSSLKKAEESIDDLILKADKSQIIEQERLAGEESIDDLILKADIGNKFALFKLAYHYQKGISVPQNYVAAHAYYNIATALGHSEAREERDDLSNDMSTEELANARELANSWKPLDPEKIFFDAVDAGDKDLINKMYKHGMSAKTTDDDGWTALFYAAVKGYDDIVVDLIAFKGADIDKQAKDGATPLMLATHMNHYKIVKYLLERGASVLKETKEGATALAIAKKNGHTRIISLLDNEMKKHIKTVQSKLYDMGYDVGVIDGIAGKGTVNAIRAFQINNGMRQDGEISKALMDKLTYAHVPNTWGTVVYSANKREWFGSWRHNARRNSEDYAMKQCRKKTNDCTIEVSFNSCVGLAWHSGGLTWVTRNTIQKAKSYVMKHCNNSSRNCNYSTTFCANGDQDK